ncbi:MAG: hypothetical protein ACN4GT_10350, partial [Gammaproteobacteria bacterium]
MTPLRIAVVDLDNWESKFIETTIAVASGIEIAQWRYITDSTEADVLLVNADSHGGEALINGQLGDSAENRPIVIPCVGRESDGDAAGHGTLGRPISYTELIALLRDLEPGLRKSKTAGPGRPGRTPEPAPPRETAEPQLRAEIAPEPAPAQDEGAHIAPDAEGAKAEPPEAKRAKQAQEPMENLTPDSDLDEQPIETEAPPNPVSDEPEAEESSEPRVSSFARTITATPAKIPDAKTVAAMERYLAKMSRPAKRFFEATRLLGLLKQSATQDKVVKLIHPAFRSITIFPHAQTYISKADLTLIPEMFRVSALQFLSRDVHETFVAENVDTSQFEPLWKLIYCAALYGSEGRMLARCNPNDKLHLLGEPDFGQV